MTVTVGTDVYDTVANSDVYWAARDTATTWVDLDTADKEVYLRKATDWLDRNFRWRGERLTEAQRLAWPRIDAIDDDNYTIGLTSAPWQVKEAMFIVADLFRNGSYDLEGIVSSNSRSLKRQKVDVIEVEYDPGSRMSGGDSIAHVIKLLAPCIAGNSDRLVRV